MITKTIKQYPEYAGKTLKGLVSGYNFRPRDTDVVIELENELRGLDIPYYLTFDEMGNGYTSPFGKQFELGDDIYIPYQSLRDHYNSNKH